MQRNGPYRIGLLRHVSYAATVSVYDRDSYVGVPSWMLTSIRNTNFLEYFVFIYEFLLKLHLTSNPTISIKLKREVVITTEEQHKLITMYFEKKRSFYIMHFANLLVLSWVSNFVGKYSKITLVMQKCQMSTILSKILTCY